MKLRASILAAVGALALAAPSVSSAAQPVIGATWSSSVQADSARMSAQISPGGLSTIYHFLYVTDAKFQENGFTGASKIPPVTDSNIGSGSSPVTATQQVAGLLPDTVYHYRVEARNSSSFPAYVVGAERTFRTLAATSGSLLPDSRGWELVSPVDKNGGAIEGPGQIAGGGLLQAAADGGSVTYGSSSSFGAGAQGAAPASQYIGRRTASGWSTENITQPIFSDTYGTTDEGVPYQLFSPDLSKAILLNGVHCRGPVSGCGVDNPPLPGTQAPASFQNYYLRTSSPAGFEALIHGAELGNTNLKAADFDLHFVGASPDLQHVVLSTCAALTANANEVPLGEGCDPEAQNLYEFSVGSGLSLVNVLPAQSQGTPGAVLAAQSGAISASGARIYWEDDTGKLYLREAGQTSEVDEGSFQTASADGSVAFYLKGEHLRRYSAGSSTDLTPGGEVKGVIGASSTGDYVYFTTPAGISSWHSGTTTAVAPGATDATNYPPTTGTARVSSAGTHLVFVSKAPITGYDNTDLSTGNPDSQVFLYDASGPTTTCVSCNPTNERPLGPSGIPGAVANGTAKGSTNLYKPRNLSSNGARVFFESRDTLASSDTNSGQVDVYQWEKNGEGSCARPEGCVALLSSGRSAAGATFIDASTSGDDVFLTTDGSLILGDPGSIDLYDARVGGGFPEPPPPIDCDGDACTPLPETPVDPTLTTTLAGHGNPAPTYFCLNKVCKKEKKHKPKKHKHKHKRHHDRKQRRAGR